MRWYVYAALAAAACALLGWSARSFYKAGYEAAETRYEAKIAEANAKALQDARAAELKLAQANDAAAQQYERGKQDAQSEADRVVADLRSGNLKLRQQWAGCETSRLSESTASTRELDAEKRRRAESASRIVRAADECDAQVAGLQAVVRAR